MATLSTTIKATIDLASMKVSKPYRFNEKTPVPTGKISGGQVTSNGSLGSDQRATAVVPSKRAVLTMMDSMGWTSPEARELFNLEARHQAEERRKQREQLSDTVKVLPTTEGTLDQLCLLLPQDFERVMRAHPAYKVQRNIELIETMLQVCHFSMGLNIGFKFSYI